jgi:hypothetical protein
MRDPIPDRKALLDIGVSGPIAGFIMAICVTITGVWLTDYWHIPVPANSGGLLYLGSPVLFDVIWRAVGPSGNYLMHPTAFAGWVGFLVTSLNLLPAGQLDGGHVARALFGEKSRYAGYAAVVILGILSLVSFNIDPVTGALVIGQGYFGWIVFIFLIIFLGLFHPPPLNDLTRLDARRKGLGALAILILFVAFVPVPIVQGTPEYDVNLIVDTTHGNVDLNGTVNYTFYVENTGNVDSDMKVAARFLDPGGRDAGWVANLSKTIVSVPAADFRAVNLTVHAPADAPVGNLSVVNITVHPDVPGGKKRYQDFTTTVGYVRLTSDKVGVIPASALPPDYVPQASFNVTLWSLQNVNHNVSYNMTVAGDPEWYGGAGENFTVNIAYPSPYTFWFKVTPPANTSAGAKETFIIRAEEAGNASRADTLELTVIMDSVHVLGARTAEPALTNLTMARGDVTVVPVVLEYRGNVHNNYTVGVRMSGGLNVTYSPDPVVFDSSGTVTRYFTFAVSPDAPNGILTAKLSFTAPPPFQENAGLDFGVLVE